MTRRRSASPAASGGEPSANLQVSVVLLGRPCLRKAGSRDIALSAKDAAMLAFLAVEGRQARAALCKLVWPGANDKRQLNSLHSRSYRLSKSTGAPVLALGDPVDLQSGIEVDLKKLGDLSGMELLAAGVLLQGMKVKGAQRLNDWIERARARIDQSIAERLAAYSEAAQQSGQMTDAVEFARAVVGRSPVSAEAIKRLLSLHYLRGDVVAARQDFRDYEVRLRDRKLTTPADVKGLIKIIEASNSPTPSPRRPALVGLNRPPKLVGRDSTWQAMWDAWFEGHPFLIVGAAGLGKSRMLQEFIRELAGVVMTDAVAEDAIEPRSLLGRILRDVDERFHPRLDRALRGELGRIHPSLGKASHAPGNLLVLDYAVESLLAAAMKKGLHALVVDDLHHAHPAAVEWLRRMSRRPALADLRMGFARRPLPEDRPLAALLADWARDSHGLVPTDLTPLTLPQLKQLLDSLQLTWAVDRSLLERLFQHAGGNPMFCLATLREVVAAGGLPDAGSLPVPTSIQAVLDDRIAALDDAACRLAYVAAVAGPEFTARRASRMLAVPLLQLAPAWSGLEREEVFRAGRFSHDLMREAALRQLPDEFRVDLHRDLAALLEGDPAVGAARIAWHWQHGGCPAQAGRHWRVAADDAGQAGLIQERSELLRAAALSFEAAEDADARFEALATRIAALQLRPGGGAVLQALPELEGLADTEERRLRCLLFRVEAYLGLGRPGTALADAEEAAKQAEGHESLLADALALRAQVTAQTVPARSPDGDAALSMCRRALACAQARGDGPQTLRARQALSFVQYCVGDLRVAVDEQREAVALARRLGDRFEAAAGEGHVAALLSVMGDVPAAYKQALIARTLHRETGIDADGLMGSINERIIGACAAASGDFGTAVDALERAIAAAGLLTDPAAVFKARLGLAEVWLTMGRGDLAVPLLQALQGDSDEPRRVQRLLLLARLAQRENRPPQNYHAQMGRIGARLANAPLMQSVDFELSFQGPPASAIERVAATRLECERRGMPGSARSLKWRELSRTLELGDADAGRRAVELADELCPFVASGLSAKCHPPQVWYTLSQAYARAGDEARQAACVTEATTWLKSALERLPAQHRVAFRLGNPIHTHFLTAPE